MKTRRLVLICLITVSALFICSCSKTASKDISNDSVDNNLKIEGDDVEINNEIFTGDFLSNIQKITFWNAGKAIDITSAEDIQAIHELLASLKIETNTLKANENKYGYTIMEITLTSKKVQMGLLSGEVVMDGEKYTVDKDIVDKIRTIALKNSK